MDRWEIWGLQTVLLAALIYFFLGFLKTTRGSGLVRGLIVAFAVIALGLWGGAQIFELEELQHILRGSTPWVGVILVILALRRGNPVTGEVARSGYGEFLMPLAIAVLFSVSRGQPPALYWLPLFLLVFADSLAALVGTELGRHRYGSKTIEGTATFLTLALAASLSVLPPGSALALALSATALEHLSWRGLDNLSVPLGSYLLLSLLSGTPIGTAS